MNECCATGNDGKGYDLAVVRSRANSIWWLRGD